MDAAGHLFFMLLFGGALAMYELLMPEVKTGLGGALAISAWVAVSLVRWMSAGRTPVVITQVTEGARINPWKILGLRALRGIGVGAPLCIDIALSSGDTPWTREISPADMAPLRCAGGTVAFLILLLARRSMRHEMFTTADTNMPLLRTLLLLLAGFSFSVGPIVALSPIYSPGHTFTLMMAATAGGARVAWIILLSAGLAADNTETPATGVVQRVIFWAGVPLGVAAVVMGVGASIGTLFLAGGALGIMVLSVASCANHTHPLPLFAVMAIAGAGLTPAMGGLALGVALALGSALALLLSRQAFGRRGGTFAKLDAAKGGDQEMSVGATRT